MIFVIFTVTIVSLILFCNLYHDLCNLHCYYSLLLILFCNLYHDLCNLHCFYSLLLNLFCNLFCRHAGKRTVLTCPLETAEEGSPPSKRRKVKSVRENGGDDAKCKSAEVMKKKKKKGYLKAMAPEKAVLSNGHADDQCISISVPASPTGDKDMVASQTEHVVEAKKSPHISHQTLLHLTSDSSSLDSEKSAPSELPETTARTINEVGTDWLSHQNNATPNLLPLAPNPPASLPVADNRKVRWHTHTHLYTFPHTLHVHILHTHTCTHPHMHTPTHACTHTHMHTPTHAHTHTCTHPHMHTPAHAHTHTCTHPHMHTHMHAYTLHTTNSYPFRG